MDVEEIQRRAKVGPLLLLGRRAFAVILSLLTTTLIAHLVSPKAFGLAAMSAVVFSLAEMFKDFGLTSALMRKGLIDQEEMSFLFWFNCATTLLLSVIIAGLSPFVAFFFHEPIVTWVMLVSLIGFTVGGLSLQHSALLNRDLKFKQIALIDVATVLVQTVVTLGCGAIWHNVWAIVIGSLSGSVTTSGLSIGLSGWRPNRPAKMKGAGELLRFGANASVFSLAVFISQNAAPILIGRFLGPVNLGQFNRAQNLFSLPFRNAIEPVIQATLPVMARLRLYPDLYREAYLNLVRRLCFLVMPASVLLAFVAIPAVELVLGARWRLAGEVLAVLSPALAGQGFSYAAGDIFITQNRSKELRTIGLIEMIMRVGAVLFGVQFGVVGAAAGFSASTVMVVPLRTWMAGREGPIDFKSQLAACIPALPIALSALFGCAAITIIDAFFELSPLLRVASVGICGCICSLLAAVTAPISRHALATMLPPQFAGRFVGPFKKLPVDAAPAPKLLD